jgi:hypothetical protein
VGCWLADTLAASHGTGVGVPFVKRCLISLLNSQFARAWQLIIIEPQGLNILISDRERENNT